MQTVTLWVVTVGNTEWRFTSKPAALDKLYSLKGAFRPVLSSRIATTRDLVGV